MNIKERALRAAIALFVAILSTIGDIMCLLDFYVKHKDEVIGIFLGMMVASSFAWTIYYYNNKMATKNQ